MDDNIQAKAQGRFYNDVCESIHTTFMSQKWWIVISCLLGKHFNGNSQICSINELSHASACDTQYAYVIFFSIKIRIDICSFMRNETQIYFSIR